MSITPERSTRNRTGTEWHRLAGLPAPTPRRDPDPIPAAVVHPLEQALLDAHKADGIHLSVHQAWLLLVAARDHLGGTVPGYPYPTWDVAWQASTATPGTAYDPREEHPLVRAIAGSLWPYAWDADGTSPEKMTAISLEHLATVLGITLPEWPETPEQLSNTQTMETVN